MFTVYCPRHQANVLLGFRRIRRVINVSPGVIAVQLVCHDGAVLELLTGSRVSASTPRTPSMPATNDR
ncbi:hypothetical protein SAMN06265360_108177 [Haloechinothrix alba]|uniref:Uncharacterized protein n=1 Tax=Haloechinothrix alba TaxID=664784 RepID=A0A238X1S9_9PSEU|nr:hypothetical protein SAMN06265360_108177 [Haloechinothrix alba]